MKKLLPLTLITVIACPPSVVFAASDIMGNYVEGTEATMPAKSSNVDPLSKLRLADTPFEACQSKAFLPAKIYNEDKEYWDQAIKALKECGSEVNLEVLPDDSFFTIKTILGKLDGTENDQAKAVEFLNRVGSKAKENIEYNIKVTKAIEGCATNPKGEGCEKLLKDLGKSIEKVRPALRQAQALSTYEDASIPEAEDARRNVNRNMKAASIALAFDAKMEPLSGKEFDRAVDTFEADTKDIQKSWDEAMERRMEQIEARRKAGQSNPILDRAYEDAKSKIGKYNTGEFVKYRTTERGKKFEQHRQEYVQQIYKAPILAYLGEDNATEKCLSEGDTKACFALASAAKKLSANSQSELAQLEKVLKGKQSVSDLISIMKYGPAVREVLGKDGKFCQSATGLANLVANKNTRNNVALVGGMLGGFVVGGWAGGAALGAAGVTTTTATVLGAAAAAGAIGGASIVMDTMNAASEERKVLSHATEDDGKAVGDIKDLTEAKEALAMNIALSPTTFIGTGIGKVALGGAAAAIVAANQGARVGARLEASSALRNALRGKGHSEESAAKLLKNLQSKDAAVARSAAQTVIKDLDLDENAMGVMRVAASKGLISQFTQKSATKAIMGEIDNAETAKSAVSILEAINPAKINEANRQQVIDVALAGARFGVDKPGYLAAKINDWEQGLDGLAATYKLAEQKLGSKEVRGLASLEQRQDKAFRLALEEQLEKNPELKALSKTEKDQMVDQMATCGLKGK